MKKTKNVLWIMADQLRWDYLSCYGHPYLKTPNIGKLAERGVRFTNAYVQSPICGPSRMSAYTGRYCRSHGSTWNGFPLRVGEPTLGDHLREVGVRPVIVGKTHMTADTKGMEWLGIDPGSKIGVTISECGFEPYERDDGLHPNGPYDPNPKYDDYLRSKGLMSKNPWNDHSNSALGEDGELLSGWLLKNSNLAANIPEEHSETPYMTDRAMDFIQEAGDQPWMCHLSYIKPHWPYIAPAPYNSMYGAESVLPPVRSTAELDSTHPVYRAYLESRVCKTFSRDEVRNRVIPVYMGLIKQIDDQLGRLFNFMEQRGLFENTMVIFTSDHGDYLGDHWMGEKDLFHDQSAKVPLIIYDPRQEADQTRGFVRNELVEMIDIAPSILSYFGAKPKPHVLEGKDLLPLIHKCQSPANWRRYAVSEYDYSMQYARSKLGIPQEDARLIMIRDSRWKLIHAEGFRPMLFDLLEDPSELNDLGESPEHENIRIRLREYLSEWARRHHNRITMSPEDIENMGQSAPPGIVIGVWDENHYQQTFGKSFPSKD